jgi:hypothetical protein
MGGFQGGAPSIQRAAEARDRNRHRDERQGGNRVELQIGERRSLEHEGAHDAQIMHERQRLAQPLRPARHPGEREYEAPNNRKLNLS